MPSMTTCMSNGTRSSAGTTSGASSISAGSDSYTGGASRHVRGKYDRYALAWSMASWSSTARLSAHPDTRDVHPRPAHLLQRGDLADDHLRHARRAEVHRGVAVDHEHDVAERRDVRPAGRRRPEQAADLRHLPGQADLVVEDVPGAAPPREQLHLVGQPGAGGVDEPHDRHLLGERRLRRPHHLLDGPRPPRPGLHHRVVGDDDRRHPVDAAPPGDDAVGGQTRRHGVGQHPVLDERTLVDEQVDALPRPSACPGHGSSPAPARQASPPAARLAKSASRTAPTLRDGLPGHVVRGGARGRA